MARLRVSERYAVAIEQLRRIRYFPLPALEAFLWGMTFGWATWLILPVDTFSTSKTFSGMAQLLTEYAWGTILLFLSTLHIIAYLSRAYGWRRVALFCVFLFWIGIEVQFVLSNPWSTSTWTYGWIAAAYGYIYIVLERDARTES